MGGQWQSALDRARLRVFAGRHRELDRFRGFLEDDGRRLLHVHGPGGVGKSFLLAEFARAANEREHRSVLLDGHWLDASPAAVRGILDEAGEGVDLLLVDTFEKLAMLEGWFRDVLLPSLPDRVRVVSAGREPLSEAWLVDPGWRELVEQLPLRNLSIEQSCEYLARREVAAERREAIAEACHGHPLSLAVAADLEAGSSRPSDPDAAGERGLRTVLRKALLEEAPDELHRRALMLGALARTVTEPLLRHALGVDDAAAIHDWLRERPFVQATPDGLLLHDLAREAFLHELRARDPELYETLLDRAIAHTLECLDRRPPGGELRLYTDAIYLVRHEPGAQLMHVGGVGDLYVDDPGRDRGRLAEVVRRHEGDRAAAIAEHWLRRAPDGWVAVRDPSQQLQGLACFVDMDRVQDADMDVDPVVAAFADELGRRDPLRGAERARLCRFWMSVEHHQQACAAQTLLFGRMSVELALAAKVAIGAAVHIPAGEWSARPDMTHELMCRLDLDGLDLGVFGHDWRKESPVRGFGRLLQVLRRAPGTRREPPDEPEIEMLDRSAFERAVRKALKHFHDPARLAANPLAAAPLVVRYGAAPGSRGAVDTLRDLLRQACASLREDDDATLATVLERTFLRPSPKQSAVADDLGMSFSTYRRRLNAALDAVTQYLWELETAGG